MPHNSTAEIAENAEMKSCFPGDLCVLGGKNICAHAQNFSSSRMQFPQALETVLETLERMRDEGGQRPCASRTALKSLQRFPASRGGVTRVQENAKVDESTSGNKTEQLAAVQTRVSACLKCPNLASSRTQTVF